MMTGATTTPDGEGSKICRRRRYITDQEVPPKPTTSFFLSRRPPVIRAGAGEEWEGRGANDLWTGVGGPRSHSFGLQTSSIILGFRSPFWHLGHKCLPGRTAVRSAH